MVNCYFEYTTGLVENQHIELCLGAHVYLCVKCMSGAQRGQKCMSVPMELKLQKVVDQHVGVGN